MSFPRTAALLATLACLLPATTATAASSRTTTTATLELTGTVADGDWSVATGTFRGPAFGPLALGSLRTHATPDGAVTGTLSVYGQRGWLVVALTGRTGTDGLLRASLGLGRGSGAFRTAGAHGDLVQTSTGTVRVTLG